MEREIEVEVRDRRAGNRHIVEIGFVIRDRRAERSLLPRKFGIKVGKQFIEEPLI